MARRRQGLADDRGSDEAGRDAVAGCADQVAQAVAHGLPPLAVDKTEGDRQCVRGGGIGHHASVRRGVGAEEGLGDPLRQLAVVTDVGFQTEESVGPCRQLCRTVEVRGGHDARVGPGVTRPLVRRVGVEPVAEMQPFLPQQSAARPVPHHVHPGRHGRVTGPERLVVREALTQHAGTTVMASPQATTGLRSPGTCGITAGTTIGTTPCAARCSSLTSSSQERRKASQS
jgi:hypothetical protein